MKSLQKVVLPLLLTVAAFGLSSRVLKADNPITKPNWKMPAGYISGNPLLSRGSQFPCNNSLFDGAAGAGLDTRLAFGDCFSQNTLLVRLTGAPGATAHPPNSLMYFVENIVQTKLLRAADLSNNPTKLFSNFLDLTLKRYLDSNSDTTLDYDPATYLYRPVTSAVGPWAPGSVGRSIGFGGYDPAPLFDRQCMDIPLVGSVCLNGYLYDVNNEKGSVFFKYETGVDFPALAPKFTLKPQANSDVEANHMTGTNCDPLIAGAAFTPCGLRGNLGATQYRDDDDGLEVKLTLNSVKLDLFFEPPTDATLTDIPGSSANYLPENDLSTYLKAYGQAELGTVQLTLNLRLAANYNDSIQPHSIAVGFELQDVLFDSDFQFVFKRGPYCNNNLGTTETPWAGTTNAQVLASERPFNNAGVRNFPGLVSDITAVAPAGVNKGGSTHPAGTYRPTVAAAFPRLASSVGGGTGAGRDRIGVNASPYQYFDTPPGSKDDRFSDNPNNCRRPADTCTLTVANGGIVLDGGVEWNGPSASCEGSSTLDPISNNSDDSTYKISEQITSIIPYIQGELKVVAQDKFKNRSRGNPGYYLGPTSIMDLGAELSKAPLMDWPLRPGTDYVYIDMLLSSDVDRDSTNEFWADSWGVMMPFNFAIGVSWNSVAGITAGTAKRLDINACVQKLPSITGYVDGFGEFKNPAPDFTTRAVEGATGSMAQNNTDDPFLTRTRGLKGISPLGGLTANKGILAGFGMPAVTWPTIIPAVALPAGAEAGTAAYGVGLAVHQNVLSAALYDAVVKGLLCADIDSTGQYAKVTDQIGGTGVADLLNTSTFELFFPALYEKYPDRPMRVRVIPLLKKYSHNSAGNPANGLGNFAVTSAVNEPRINPVNGLPLPNRLQIGAEAPYVIMGGPAIQMSLAYNTDQTGAFIQSQYIWPDLSIVIPNLLVEFYVYGKTASDNNWYRVFAIDMGVLVGLNIDIVKSPGRYTNLNTVATAAQATFYPIGCNPASTVGMTDYCSGGYAYTKRVLRLAGLADPEINAIIEYSELSFGNPNGSNSGVGFICGGGVVNGGQPRPPEATGAACTTGGGSVRPVSNAFSDPAILKGAMSNLIGLALSLDLSALVEVGFDLGAFLNIPIVIDAPYIGPSYAVGAAGTTNATDREQPTPNGFGDYLVAGLSFDLAALNSSYLIQQIDYILDGTDSTKPFGLDLTLAPGESAPSQPAEISVPQATVQAPLKVSAAETIFRFSGHDSTDGKNVQYSWRVDNGVWTVFSKADSARIVGLLEGKHTFEVKALNSQGMMQDVPARYTFVVDSIAPKIRVVGDRTVGSRASFFVEANDWLTPKEDIRVAYQIDNGHWSNFGYNKKISVSGLREGRHTLRVKAADNAGNNGETAFNFSASDGGFGCSTTSGSGSLADVLVMLVIPALVILRKRLF